MPKLPIATVTIAALALAVLAGLADPAEARHRRHHHLGMHGWCRADAAQMMGVRRSAVRLAPHVMRIETGRYVLPGIASHGVYGDRAFVCHFNERRVLQGAV